MISKSQYYIYTSNLLARLLTQFHAIPGSLPIPGEQAYALISIFIHYRYFIKPPTQTYLSIAAKEKQRSLPLADMQQSK